MTVELREVIERERVPYPDKVKLFTVPGLLSVVESHWVKPLSCWA